MTSTLIATKFKRVMQLPQQAISRMLLIAAVAAALVLYIIPRQNQHEQYLKLLRLSDVRSDCPILAASRLWPAALGDPTTQRDRQPLAQPSAKCEVRKLGHEDYGYWHVCETDVLRRGNAMIFSFGLGTDTSFDEHAIREYKAVVHGFDPILGSQKFVAGRQKELPACFFGLHNLALDVENTVLKLYPPENPNHISHNQTPRKGANPVLAPAVSLKTAMDMLGIAYMHILKLDIEGAEFPIMRGLLNDIANGISSFNAFPCDQLLVEFHPTSGGNNSRADMLSIINDLTTLAGFKLSYAVESRNEYSFYRATETGL